MIYTPSVYLTVTPRQVVMIYTPDEDAGFYKCDAIYTTTSPVVGTNTEYQVSQYKLGGDGKFSPPIREQRFVSSTSDWFTFDWPDDSYKTQQVIWADPNLSETDRRLVYYVSPQGRYIPEPRQPRSSPPSPLLTSLLWMTR